MEAKSSSSRCHSNTSSGSGLQGSSSRRGRAAAAALEAPTPCTTHCCCCCCCCSPSQVKRQQPCHVMLGSISAPRSSEPFGGQKNCICIIVVFPVLQVKQSSFACHLKQAIKKIKFRAMEICLLCFFCAFCERSAISSSISSMVNNHTDPGQVSAVKQKWVDCSDQFTNILAQTF